MALLGISLIEVLVTFVAFLAVYLTFVQRKKHPNYPPGPPGLPLLGNIAQLGKYPHMQFSKWAEQYGKIFSIKLGLDNAVVINDPKLIKELFGEAAASGRPHNPVLQAMTEGNYGIVNTEEQSWEEIRRFTLRKLRDFGFAKSSMEGMIVEEASNVVNWFLEHKGKPISCNRIFNIAVVSSLWYLVSGEKSDWKATEDGGSSEIAEKSENLMEGLKKSVQSGLMFVPFMRYIVPNLSGWNFLIAASTDLNKVSEEAIVRHKTQLNSNCPKDLIDHWLLEIANTKDPNSSFYQTLGEKNLKASVLDLFEAGNETTSATLTWALLYLCHHPGIQQKLIDEIDRVVGKSRLPSLSDKSSLPYTEAVIMEVLRKSVLLPMGVMHRMLKDQMFHGYYLPKNTVLIPNFYYSMHHPSIWGDPQNFRPERFLSDDGSKVVRNEALIPFSVGKRQCLGESLARDTLFLFLVSIFQKCEILPDPDNPKPDFDPEPHFINFAKPFRFVIKELP